MATSIVNYGSDLWCGPDLKSDMRVVSGRTLVAQAVYRRFITPRGSLKDDPNYGLDLEQLLNDDTGPDAVGRITAAIQAEAVKDERIFTASASVSLAAGALSVSLTLTDALGHFLLVLGVSSVGVTLLQAP